MDHLIAQTIYGRLTVITTHDGGFLVTVSNGDTYSRIEGKVIDGRLTIVKNEEETVQW